MAIMDDYEATLNKYSDSLEELIVLQRERISQVIEITYIYEKVDALLEKIDSRDRMGLASEQELTIHDDLLDIFEQAAIEKDFSFISRNFDNEVYEV